MTKQEVERELKKYNGGAMLINQSELMKALHRGRTAVKDMMTGLPYIRNGQKVQYPVKAVASRVFELLNARDYEEV